MPLSKEQLWAIYTQKNPHWLTEGATLTPAGLRKLFEQTFDRGHDLGVENGKTLAVQGGRKATERAWTPTEEFMRDFFRMEKGLKS